VWPGESRRAKIGVRESRGISGVTWEGGVNLESPFKTYKDQKAVVWEKASTDKGGGNQEKGSVIKKRSEGSCHDGLCNRGR